MNKIILIPVLATSIISACGGGGGGSSTPAVTDPNKSFSLQKFTPENSGTVYSSNVAGTIEDSDNSVNFTGSISVQNNPQTMINGILVTPRDVLITLQSGDIVDSIVTTSYYDSDGYLIQTTDSSLTTCVPITTNKLPEAVKIGDFGQFAILSCSDGNTKSIAWRAEDGKNGFLDFTEYTTVTDRYDAQLDISSQTTYKLNAAGEIVSIDLLGNSDGFIVKLKSK